MRSSFQTAQPLAFLLANLSINTERIMVSLYTVTTTSPGWVDRLDAALIELLAAEPRVGVLEASRRLRVSGSSRDRSRAAAACPDTAGVVPAGRALRRRNAL